MDPLADLEHEGDVVVDEQDACAVVADGVDRGREARNLRLGKPSGRLVHEHETGLGRQRPRDPEPPLIAVRQLRCRAVRVAPEIE